MAKVFVTLFVTLFSVYLTEQANFLKQDYINKINSKVTTWKAGVNFDPDTLKEDIVKLLGSKTSQNLQNSAHPIQYKTHDEAYNRLTKIPGKFDARIEWPLCRTIGSVHNQGRCGSCWAVSTSSAFADRLCIATNGEFNEHLSAEELMSCCHSCGNGCHGGEPLQAWEHFKRFGVVTGGKYLSYQGCQPYRVPPYHRKENHGDESMEKRHECIEFCFGNHSMRHYRKDHRYTNDAYYLDDASIQKDVMTYGPIEASFEVYDDFVNYKSGIYEKSNDAQYLGGHSVKLIGWGEENGVLYWTMVNSWGENWGENGFFKISRGTNECGIEDQTTAGIPKTNK